MQSLLDKFIKRFFSNEESVYFAVLLIFSFLFIIFFGDILLPVIISVVIAFLLNGLMNALLKMDISQRLSLTITLIVFFGCYMSLFFALPSIGTEINNLLQNLPIIVSSFQQTLVEMNNYFSKEDIDLISKNMIDNVFFGLGIDCHSLEKGTGIIIGGYEIKCNLKSVAHSDGDVLTHAIIDALCGALNLGDIGQHFPNTPKNKNISSIKLLEEIMSLIPKNISIVNIDASVVLNSPKISKYKSKITSTLAPILKISESQISIKGITSNGLSFIDMKNGWGAEVIISLKRWK